ncbi:MAG: Grx4 family monothiol glutaredoxin [Myxococcota bacterium]
MSDVNARIKDLVENHEVVLFMKGTRMFPQCGFSQRAVDIMKQVGIKFKDVNVLTDNAIRQGVKEFSDWPTIPQVYVKGEFVGGSDILLEMFENGELHKLMGLEPPKAPAPPKVTVTDKAREAFSSAMKDAGGDVLRFEVSPNFQYELYFAPKQPKDFAIDAGGLTLHVPPACAGRADGSTIDFIEGPDGAGFRIDNPNEPASVKSMSVAELKALIDNGMTKDGQTLHLFDVRRDDERVLAKLEAAVPFDQEARTKLDDLPKDTPIAFMCHHGGRSRAASEQYLKLGFTQVYNIVGGIDQYSSVDPSVPRY